MDREVVTIEVSPIWQALGPAILRRIERHDRELVASIDVQKSRGLVELKSLKKLGAMPKHEIAAALADEALRDPRSEGAQA